MFHVFKVIRFILFVFVNKIIMSYYLIIKAFNLSILTAGTFLLQHTEAATGGLL